MKLNNLDLNLLVVFNAIYTEGSLTKAGEIVGITQPAVSSALSKLREYFDDQLFIRVGQGVKPTAKTENIIIHVRDALSILQKSIERPESFDPAVSSRTFRLSLNDVSEGLAQTQKEKLASLAESVEFESEEQYRGKLETLKESYFAQKNVSTPAKTETLSEGVEAPVSYNGSMDAYMRALGSTLGK